MHTFSRRVRLSAPEEEWLDELARCAPNDPLGEAAREKLVERHIPMIAAQARRLHRAYRKYIELEDLISAGCVGLLKALARFDRKRRLRINTYAMWWVRNEMHQAARQARWPTSISDWSYKQLPELANALAAQALSYDRVIDQERLMADLKWPAFKVRRLLAWLLDETVSTELAISDDGKINLGHQLTSDHNAYAELERAQYISVAAAATDRAFRRLTPRERQVITLTFGFPGPDLPTKEALCEELRITRTTLNKTYERAMRKLRAHPAIIKLSPKSTSRASS